jgi:hypothetical protein
VVSRLTAIPVGQGDAFYLERAGWSVLVDGGRSRSGFASAFQMATRANGASVVVCTHNDADHATGILGFLEAGFTCGEVWLPGRWLGALRSVLRPFVKVFVDIADNVAQVATLSNRPEGIASIEAYAEHLRESSNDRSAREEGPPIGENGWPESYTEMLEQADPWELAPWMQLWPPEDWQFFHYPDYGRLDPPAVQLLWSAIDAASRIRAIAIETFHRGIPVRWFEFDATNPSGGVANLQLVNARQVARVRPLVGSLLAFLALTVSNKESLVLWSPPTSHDPGVLFTADSDLSGIRLPYQLTGAVATAPHHGSEANANAYAVVTAAAGRDSPSVSWVRSDGSFRRRPGPTYLGLPSRRFCKLCRNPSSSKQAVQLSVQGGSWASQGTYPCQCR